MYQEMIDKLHYEFPYSNIQIISEQGSNAIDGINGVIYIRTQCNCLYESIWGRLHEKTLNQVISGFIEDMDPDRRKERLKEEAIETIKRLQKEHNL